MARNFLDFKSEMQSVSDQEKGSALCPPLHSGVLECISKVEQRIKYKIVSLGLKDQDGTTIEVKVL